MKTMALLCLDNHEIFPGIPKTDSNIKILCLQRLKKGHIQMLCGEVTCTALHHLSLLAVEDYSRGCRGLGRPDVYEHSAGTLIQTICKTVRHPCSRLVRCHTTNL